MKLKILLVLLIVSVGMNLIFLLIPIVTDQYTVASSVMIGHAFRLLDCYEKSGLLPSELPVEDNILPLDISYKRLDDRHATMRTCVNNRFSFITLYIGCDIEMSAK